MKVAEVVQMSELAEKGQIWIWRCLRVTKTDVEGSEIIKGGKDVGKNGRILK